ncbi:hypothetical protein ACWGH2_36185 [Streptomyces sp. NPDC054871]
MVQETWMRLARQGEATIGKVAGWLTAVVGRISLDLLRSRRAHPETAYEHEFTNLVVTSVDDPAPDEQVALADSVGLAPLVDLPVRSSELTALLGRWSTWRLSQGRSVRERPPDIWPRICRPAATEAANPRTGTGSDGVCGFLTDVQRQQVGAGGSRRVAPTGCAACLVRPVLCPVWPGDEAADS